jgi:hypothetical protein
MDPADIQVIRSQLLVHVTDLLTTLAGTAQRSPK